MILRYVVPFSVSFVCGFAQSSLHFPKGLAWLIPILVGVAIFSSFMTFRPKKSETNAAENETATQSPFAVFIARFKS